MRLLPFKGSLTGFTEPSVFTRGFLREVFRQQAVMFSSQVSRRLVAATAIADE
jgi:hypothetical protein